MNFLKKKTVKDLWYMFFILCLLTLNIYVFIILFNSNLNYEATSSILQQIEFSADSYQTDKYTLDSTDSNLRSIIYFAKVVPLYFTESFIVFPKMGLNSSNSSIADFSSNLTINDTNVNSNETAINYIIGYNLLCENMIRMTIRRKNY